MSQATTYRLSPSQEAAAHEGAANASQYLREADHSLGMALLEYHWNDGTALDTIEALRDYQNADGGFGNGLEVDIASPASNPFAARLAMITLRDLEPDASATLSQEVQAWLVANQAPDGDWHFSSDTRSENLAPWFAGWTFPSLNPACCIAGLANSLGIATRDMLARVERLFREKSSLEEARAGTFYNLLPYVEYAGGVPIPDRDVWLDAIATNVARADAEGTYADASHFWEHALGGGPDLIARLPHDLLAREVDLLLTEQEPDGGWPSPYSPGWRPWVTAQACVTLARLRDGS